MGFFDKFKKQKTENNAENGDAVSTPSKKNAIDLENEKYIDRDNSTIKIRGHNPFVPSGIIPVSKEVLDDNSALEFSRIFSVRIRKTIPDAEKPHRFARMYAANIPAFYKFGNIIAGISVVLILGLWVYENTKQTSKVYITLPDGKVQEIKTYTNIKDAMGASIKLTQLAESNRENEFKSTNKDVPIVMFDKNLTASAPSQGNPGIPNNPVGTNQPISTQP